MSSRNEVVELARSWVGLNEADGSYKKIIDIYNKLVNPKPRGVTMRYDWAWCACTWSALAAKLEYLHIMPVEISCNELINQAKKMGCWVEPDDYTPQPGDAVLYDWDDSGVGDNVGFPDHVGVVEYVNCLSGYFVVIEGNYQDAVKRRTVSLNGRYIRGFIVPEYKSNKIEEPDKTFAKTVKEAAIEVIAGLWGNGIARRLNLMKAGFDPEKVQKKVNDILNDTSKKPVSEGVKADAIYDNTCYAQFNDKSIRGTYQTTADLYCRNDAGTNKKALCLIPKGAKVNCYGYYSISNNVKWYYISFDLNGAKYTGFSSSQYLKKVD